MHRFRFLWAGLLTVALTGCVSIPEPLSGEIDDRPFPEEASEADRGRTLLWGGTLVVTRPGETSTCLEILARPLDAQRRPELGDRTHGRFHACHRGFLDPEIFAAGREVTVVGELTAFRIDNVGEFDYRFPRLRTETVHLWPERPLFDDRYYYDPYWRYHGWPYWPYGGRYWIHYNPSHGPAPARPHPAPVRATPRQPTSPVK